MMTLTATKAVDPDKQTRLERKAERELAAALATWSAAILRGVNSNNIQVMGQRVSDQQWPPNVAMRDALYNVLLRAAEEGGGDGLAAIYGGQTKAISIDPTSVDWELVNTAAARWARSYSHLLMSGISDTTRDMIAGEIAYYVESGISINELRDRIAQSAAFSKQRARRIAVTETTRAYAEGNLAAWADKDYIVGSRWQTANDDLVCPICGPLNQKTARKGELFAGRYYSPPAHVNCRCGLSPVVTGAEDAGVASGVPGEAAASWGATLDEIGKELVRRGLVSEADFTDWLDTDKARRVAEQFTKLAETYTPDYPVNSLKVARIMSNGRNSLEGGRTQITLSTWVDKPPAGSRFNIGPDVFMEQMQSGYNVRVRAGEEIEALITHEFGHSVIRTSGMTEDELAALKGIRSRWLRETNKLARAGAYKEGHPLFEEFAGKAISDYARTSLDELLAEAFTEYHHGRRISPYTQEIMKLFDSRRITP